MASALVWFRRDLRLADNPALLAALDAGYAPIPVYIHAPGEESPWMPGAASTVWLRRSLEALDAALRVRGSGLLVVPGPSLAAIEKLLTITDAEAVFWNRLYEPAARRRDGSVKEAIKARGLTVASFNSSLLVEPWTIASQSGAPYRVFTPFWRNACQRLEGLVVRAAPDALPPLPKGLGGLGIDELGLDPPPSQPRWDTEFWQHWQAGEEGAAEMLEAFVEGAAGGYREQRNFPDRCGTSRLSPHLHFGELSPQQIVCRLRREKWPERYAGDLAHFHSELGWREFSHHLLFHFPDTPERNLNDRFECFPWRSPEPDELAAWQRGRTGVPIVDAGMRELWRTGWMHNRVRMIVASFLCKNLRYHWRLGAEWFWQTLVDANLANNTQGWQWTAGTGADAAPYFRIFNPVTQAEKFDPESRYISRWVPELAALPPAARRAPWQYPQLANSIAGDYPRKPIVDLAVSRDQALAAYAGSKPMTGP
jgi:deoxyribodipyrimidine photo-lyase